MITQASDPAEELTLEEAFEAGVVVGKEIAFQLLVDPPPGHEATRDELIDLVLAIRERARRGD